MKKTIIVLCGTALLLVGLFCFGFVATTTARPAVSPGINPWQFARAGEIKMLTAKEMDSADAIKRLRGIADVEVVTHTGPITSASVFVAAPDNRPIDISVINAISLIVAPLFGVTDMEEICIVDTKHSRKYNGAGEALPREPATVSAQSR